jgi:RNA polymerase sigma factor for flagellar operon FliA
VVGELRRLWEQYAKTQTPELRRELIESYAPLARYVVERMNLRPGPSLGYEDLLGQAVVGLIDAIDRFDLTRGIKFETYAYHRIRGAVMDMLREMDWLPRSIRQRESELSAAIEELGEHLGRPPSDEELADKLGVTVAELDQLAHQLAMQAVQSLDEIVGSREWEAGTMADLVSDEEAPSPEDEMQKTAEREMLAEAIDQLPDSERTVISLYYYEGLTLKEIGRVLGVTESRACQIHGKAMVRLRAQMAARTRMKVASTPIGKSAAHRATPPEPSHWAPRR